MKLFLALGSAAVLTAACAASATVSGSGAGSHKTAHPVQLATGVNAGSTVAGEDDINRTNPLAGKPGSHPVTPVQPAGPVAAAPAQPPGNVQDRCSIGTGTGQPGNGPQFGSSSKHPPLPMCAPQ